MESISRARSLVGDKPEGRPKDDFYPTPRIATEALIASGYLDPIYTIWEPACGDGAISRVLNENGYHVESSDLFDHGFGSTGVDFLSYSAKRRSITIVTNPPFVLAEEFLIHAKLDLEVPNIFFLAKLAFLEGVQRSRLLEQTNLSRVLVFRKRLTLTRNGEPSRNGGMIAFAWFCWLKNWTGKPEIEWI